MLSGYESYPSGETDRPADMDTVIASTTVGVAHQDTYGMFGFFSTADTRWGNPSDEGADSYTLTVLSDGRESDQHTGPPLHPTGHPMAHSLGFHHFTEQLPLDHQYPGHTYPAPAWEQHGLGHGGDECVVSGSDGADADAERRCVKSLLHVALQKGSGFAQQFTSCGLPPYPIKQEFVTSTSAMSPRPQTPVESLRCFSPRYASNLSCPPYSLTMSPTPSPVYPTTIASGPASSGYAVSMPPTSHDDVVSTTTSMSYSMGCYTSPAPSYSAFRTPYPTPSPQPIMPLPVHLLPTVVAPFGEITSPPSTPTSTSTRRRRNRSQAQGGVAPKKRERSERQLHPCTLCEKRFKDNYSVNVHMRTHTGEKPFPCAVCGKMFRQKAHLAKHRSTHQAAEYAAAVSRSVDGNANCLPLWMKAAETKCKANSLWTPSVLSAPVRTVQ